MCCAKFLIKEDSKIYILVIVGVKRHVFFIINSNSCKSTHVKVFEISSILSYTNLMQDFRIRYAKKTIFKVVLLFAIEVTVLSIF